MILIKPRDIVQTPSGRVARVIDLNADGSRTVRFLDGGGEIDIMPAHLVLLEAAKPVQWLRRAPRDLETADRIKPLFERLR